MRPLRAAWAAPNDGTISTLSPKSLQHPFAVRHGTTDVAEFVHTICRRTYDFALPASAHAILDLGANIGDTGAWFLSRYPDARVISVEPDPDNYAAAARNLAAYGPRSILIQAAIWHYDGEVPLVQNREWPSGSRVDDAHATARVRAVSVASLLRAHGIGDVDILKCDVEGAEERVFAEAPDPWLSRTRMLCIEIHSTAAQAIVDTATQRCGFGSGVRRRDVTFYTRGQG